MSILIQEKETRERLLRNVKKECKQLMEVAVTKKFINEDNGCITSLCATIEPCILHGLKRSAVGLFKTSTTITLLQKVSKNCDEAKLILQMCNDYDKTYCSNANQPTVSYQNGNQSSTKDFSYLPIGVNQQQQQQSIFSRRLFSNTIESSVSPLMNGRSFSPTYYKGSSCYKLLWIRLALLNKCLIKIVEHLISNSSKYYAQYALMGDPVDGPIFASLLIGPCALEYTRMKTCDQLWADPNADELIQRHKMHSSGQLGNSQNQQSGDTCCGNSLSPKANSGSSSKLLGLNGSLIAKRKASINAAMFDEVLLLSPIGGNIGQISPRERESLPPLTPSYFSASIPPPPPVSMVANSAKEYVESLHQNSKSQLIYGKNHVIVSQKDTQFPGYLSLHANSNGLVLKWTPNQLMSVGSSNDSFPPNKIKSGGYWDYALNIDMNTIVYLHCHQQPQPNISGASIVLVGQDGIQHPPIRFPKGSHLLQFLTCLEAGLAPEGALDPPLRMEFGKGKVFPRLHRRSLKKKYDQENEDPSSVNANGSELSLNDVIDDDQGGDFVFRIINSKSNISVTTVSNENPKKFEFSISVSNDDNSPLRLPSIDLPNDLQSDSKNNIINSIFPKKKPKRIDAFFSSLSFKSNRLNNLSGRNGSLESNQTTSVSPKILKYTDSDSIKSAPIFSSTTVPYFQPNNSLSSFDSGMLIYAKVDTTLSQDSTEVYSPSHIRSSLKILCEDMRKQILSRAFYGWLAYHRQIKTINLHLIGLINCDNKNIQEAEEDEEGLVEDVESAPFTLSIEDDLEAIEKLLDDGEDETKAHGVDIMSKKSFNKVCEWYMVNKKRLDLKLWTKLSAEQNGKSCLVKNKNNIYKIVYYNGIENNMRKQIWPFLLEHYTIDMNSEERVIKDTITRENYSNLIEAWKPFEDYVKTRDIKQSNESSSTLLPFTKTPTNSPNVKNLSPINKTKQYHNNISPPAFVNANSIEGDDKTSTTTKSLFNFNLLKSSPNKYLVRKESSLSNEVFVNEEKDTSTSFLSKFSARNIFSKLMQKNLDTETIIINEEERKTTTPPTHSPETVDDDKKLAKEIVASVLTKVIEDLNNPKIPQTVSNLSNYDDCCESLASKNPTNLRSDTQSSIDEIYHDVETEYSNDTLNCLIEKAESRAGTNSGVNQKSINDPELIDSFALNMHRIDKDVTRCDRNYSYFVENENLQKLKNIMYTYVWENLSIGYIQGMCDLVAPLLVIFDDEPMAYSCFKQLMKRMSSNFPHGTAMDQHFSNMRTLIQIVDSDLFEHMHHRGDYTHFYFSYRWFLLDFKRELVYDDVFSVWETIWAAKYVCSAHFHLFIALALVETYRDIIIENNMDFTDIIKFFNEMAEKHNINQILELARNLIQQIQNLIDKKNDNFVDNIKA